MVHLQGIESALLARVLSVALVAAVFAAAEQLGLSSGLIHGQFCLLARTWQHWQVPEGKRPRYLAEGQQLCG